MNHAKLLPYLFDLQLTFRAAIKIKHKLQSVVFIKNISITGLWGLSTIRLNHQLRIAPFRQ